MSHELIYVLWRQVSFDYMLIGSYKTREAAVADKRRLEELVELHANKAEADHKCPEKVPPEILALDPGFMPHMLWLVGRVEYSVGSVHYSDR